jgi:hypothetical protein
MNSLRGTTTLRLLTGAAALFLLVSYFGGFASSSFMMASRDTTSPADGLAVTLHQSATSPPSVTVRVTNNNAGAVTVLTYDSPLDPIALQLGLLTVTPAGAAAPLDLPVVQVRRRWPPPADALTELAPGASAENELVLQEPIVEPGQLGTKAAVQLKGRWTAVWANGKAEVDLGAWNEDSTKASADFDSGSIDINVG